MNQNLQSSAPSGRGLCPEDVVIIVAVGIGFVGSVIILVLFNLPSIVVAVFLATGVASLVYRFLGGIQGATFNLGPVKLAGTIAALIGCAYFINMELKCDLSKVTDWFAVDARYQKGARVRVKLEGVKGSIKKPKSDLLANEPLDIRHKPNRFTIASKADSEFVLGHVTVRDLREINLFDTIEKKLDEFVVTDCLRAGTKNEPLESIPFKLSTGTYKKNSSEYILTGSAGDTLYKNSLDPKQAEIVKLRGKYYLVGVVEVDHNYSVGTTEVDGKTSVDTLARPYAKFVVAEIATDIEP